MKKFKLFAILILLNSNWAFSMYTNSGNGDQLLTRTDGNNICLYEKKHNDIKPISYNAINKNELRKALRSTTYFRRLLIAFPSVVVQTTLGSNLALFLTAASITATFDDFSHFSYGFLPFGIGERILRGRRLDNLLSGNEHVINNRRYEKILNIVPTLSKTTTTCSLEPIEST